MEGPGATEEPATMEGSAATKPTAAESFATATAVGRVSAIYLPFSEGATPLPLEGRGSFAITALVKAG